jgi:hypothetical protein
MSFIGIDQRLIAAGFRSAHYKPAARGVVIAMLNALDELAAFAIPHN